MAARRSRQHGAPSLLQQRTQGCNPTSQPAPAPQEGLDRIERATTIQQVIDLINPATGRGPRYHKLNITNLGPGGGHGHGTLEFRMHQGTSFPKKTVCWVELLQVRQQGCDSHSRVLRACPAAAAAAPAATL